MRLLHRIPYKSRRGWLLAGLGLAILIILTAVLLPAMASRVAQAQRPAVDRPAALAQETPAPHNDRERYSRGDTNLEFRWGMLMDALALAVARFWQCCGLIVVLALPVFFVVLWVKSRNRRSH